MSTRPETTKESKLPRWAKQAIALVIIIILAAVTILFLDLSAGRRWDRYAAGLRDRGQPITFAEIEALRAVVPDEFNSAKVIEGLFEDLRAMTKSGAAGADVLVLGRGSPEASLQTGIPRRLIEPSREFLSEHEHILEALEPIHDMPSGRFPFDLQRNPSDIMLPDLTHLRAASKLVHLAATIDLIDGNSKRAADYVALVFRLAGSLHDEPTVISRLVQIAIQALAVQGVEDILWVGPPSDEILDRLSNEVESALASGTMKWGLLGERAGFVKYCDLIASGEISLSEFESGVGSGDGPPPGVIWAMSWLIRGNQVTGADMLTWLVDAADDGLALRAAARKIEVKTPKLPKTQFIVRILLPNLARAVELDLRMAARLECARAAIAAERFRRSEGRLPESLDELVPQYLDTVPTDPFDGRGMRLATTEEGIVIYSISGNLIDDGGDVAERTGRGERALDVGFRLLLPDRREVLLIDDPPPDDD